jgi:hypothetical protein
MFAQRPQNVPDVAASPFLDRLAARYFVAEPDAPVLGLADPLAQPATMVARAVGQVVEQPASVGELRVVRPQDDGLRTVFTRAPPYTSARALPRFRWASQELVVVDPKQRLETLARGPAADTTVVTRPGPPAEGYPAEPDVRSGTGDELVVDVRAQGAGYLVVADALQRDWVAEVDGLPGELVPADHALVAIHVPAGEHTVELRYAAVPWTWGPGVGGSLSVGALRPRPGERPAGSLSTSSVSTPVNGPTRATGESAGNMSATRIRP